MLVENKVGGKIFFLLVDGRSAVAEAIFGASNFFTGLSTLNNHVAFKFSNGKKDGSNEFADRSVVDKPHVKNKNMNAAGEQRVNEREPFGGRTSKTVKFGNDKSIARLEALNQSV